MRDNGPSAQTHQTLRRFHWLKAIGRLLNGLHSPLRMRSADYTWVVARRGLKASQSCSNDLMPCTRR